jgi:hypothetical protein
MLLTDKAHFLAGAGIYFFVTMSTLASESTKTFVQQVEGMLL